MQWLKSLFWIFLQTASAIFNASNEKWHFTTFIVTQTFFFSCHSMFQMGFVYLEVAIQRLSMEIMCILIGTALSRVLFAPWLLVIDRRPKSSFRARQVLELRGSRKRRFRTDSACWWGQWCFWSLSTSKKNLMRRFRLLLNQNKKKLKRPIWFFLSLGALF